MFKMFMNRVKLAYQVLTATEESLADLVLALNIVERTAGISELHICKLRRFGVNGNFKRFESLFKITLK